MIVNVSLDIDVFNPVPLAPTIVKVSVALLAVVDPTLPVTVLNWSGALALAVIVKTSPDTAVVIPAPPATLMLSPILNAVPDESSPTTFNPVSVFCA